LLDGRDRTLAAATAPPQGLSLESVAYAEQFGVPGWQGAIAFRAIIVPPHDKGSR